MSIILIPGKGEAIVARFYNQFERGDLNIK